MGAIFNKFVTGQGQLPPALQTDPTTGQPVAAATTDQANAAATNGQANAAPAVPSVVVPGKPLTVLRQNAPPNAFGQFVSPPVTIPLDSTAPPASGPPPTPPSQVPFWGPAIDYAKNIGTGLESAAADVAGTPRFLQDLIHKYIPQALQLPDLITTAPASTIRQKIVGQTGLDYVPSTPGGRIAQTAAEFGGAGILGGPEAIPLATLSGVVKQGGQELGLPDWFNTAASIATPFLAHTAGGTVSLLRRPTTVAGQEAGAGQVIRESMDNPNAPMQPTPIADPAYWPQGQIRQTAGQAFGDPTLQSFEQGRFQSSPEMRTQFEKINQAANQAGTNVLNTVGNFPNRAEAGTQSLTASTGMQTATQDALETAQNAERTAWQQVDPNRLTAFDTVALKQNVNNYVNGTAPGPSGRILSKAAQEYIPTNTVKIINNLNPTEPLDELQELRSQLSTRARNLYATGTNDNEANVVAGLRDIVANHIDNLTMPNPTLQASYDNARLLTQQLHNTFDNPVNPATKLVQRVLKSPTGSTTAGNTFMSTPEGFDAYYKATGGSLQAIQHAQDYFLAGLARKSLGTGEQMGADSYTSYLNKPANQALLNDRRLFTQDQADAINQVAAQLDHTAQTGRAGAGMGGSQTFRQIAAGEQAQALVGKPAQVAANVASKLKEGGMAWIGHHLGGWPGAIAGWGVSHMIPDFSYEQAGQKVLNLVDQALQNPVLADRLRQIQLSSPYANFAPAAKATAVPILLGGGSR